MVLSRQSRFGKTVLSHLPLKIQAKTFAQIFGLEVKNRIRSGTLRHADRIRNYKPQRFWVVIGYDSHRFTVEPFWLFIGLYLTAYPGIFPLAEIQVLFVLFPQGWDCSGNFRRLEIWHYSRNSINWSTQPSAESTLLIDEWMVLFAFFCCSFEKAANF